MFVFYVDSFDSGIGFVQIVPLLNDLRNGNLVGNLEALTKSASEAAADIHKLQNEVWSCCCGTCKGCFVWACP
jgi:hypothetical protein